ncbi:ricin-type beta-trefoil lectin domain protein [Streptomyces sp. NPDC003007]
MGEAPEAFPGASGQAHGGFPDAVGVAREVFPDPSGPQAPAGFPGVSGRQARGGFRDASGRQVGADFSAPSGPQAPAGLLDPSGRQARGGHRRRRAPARQAAEPEEARAGFPDPSVAAREVYPDSARAARGAFADPAGEARDVFPDPVALAGAVGESFTDPGDGPVAVPPPPTGADGADPAVDRGRAPVPAPAGVSVPPPTAPPGPRPEGPRTAARRSAHKAARRAARRRNLTAGILTAGGLVVLPLVLWSTGNSGDGASTGADRPAGEAPDSAADMSATDPSRAGSGDAGKGALRGRLHNVASDLCVGIDGKKAVAGGEAELTACSADSTQQWTYETDGLLRNGAAPDLCLDSQLGYSVRLAPCTGASRPDPKNIHYDFTLQGALVPRWDQDLALAPAATDGSGALVVKTRTDDDAQRWVIDTSKADLQMEAVNWNAAVPAPRPTPTPTPTPTPSKAPEPTPSATSSAPQPAPSTPAATDSPCYRYGYYCDADGRYGNPDHGYPGYGYGGYGYGGYGHGAGGGGRR